jgi:outer membrane protein OmpA-like peptidoglycan-associated protein
MKKTLLLSRLLGLLIIPGTALAQSPPPPPPPPPLPPPAVAADSESSSPARASDVSPPPASAPASDNESDGISPRSEAPPATHSTPENSIEEPSREWNAARALALGMGNTLLGPSGLLHVTSADSGDAGTLRISLLGSYFSGKGFLCPNCETANGSVVTRQDSVRVSTQRLQLSVTLADFLEAHAALRFRQASNNRGTPRVIQISDDAWLGAKAFTPRGDGRRVSAGGGINVGLLSEAGGVGIGTANVLLHGEGTLDLTQNPQADKAIPLRVHLNAGYLFDNSGALADKIEKKRSASLGSEQRVTRIERFGFDISRMDSVRFGLGVEGVFPYIRPFAEWTLDLPANRQGYRCRRSSLSAGDQCLTRGKGFDSTPSRLTLGARGYPWLTSWAQGIGILAAIDIGTGATSSFVEEITPELPWTLHFGLAYAFDTRPHIERISTQKTVLVAVPPPPAQYIEGTVVDTSGQPIAQAAVLFKDSDRPGMLSDSGGHFRTVDLTEGPYTFRVRKDGFGDAECSGTVIKADLAPALAPTSTLPAPRTPNSTPTAHVTEVRCELSPLPTGARVDGIVRDAESTQYVASGAVRATDARGRALNLQTDESGAFRFENVPPGKLRVQVEAEGYLPSAVELELKPRDAVAVQVSIHKRPKLSNVVVTKKELKLKKQVHFLHDSSEILPDSQELVEEIAEALRTRPEIGAVEIQGHTDNSGTPEHNQALSERRAEAVRGSLILLGIESNRLVARGYGQQQPLVPNTSAANKARNRRVQLMIQGP